MRLSDALRDTLRDARTGVLFGALFVIGACGACASPRAQSIGREPPRAARTALPAQATQPTRATETTPKRETAPTSATPTADKLAKSNSGGDDPACPSGMKLVDGDYCTKLDLECKRSWYDKSNKKTV